MRLLPEFCGLTSSSSSQAIMPKLNNCVDAFATERLTTPYGTYAVPRKKTRGLPPPVVLSTAVPCENAWATIVLDASRTSASGVYSAIGGWPLTVPGVVSRDPQISTMPGTLPAPDAL